MVVKIFGKNELSESSFRVSLNRRENDAQGIPKLFFSGLFIYGKAHRAVIFAIAQISCRGLSLLWLSFMWFMGWVSSFLTAHQHIVGYAVPYYYKKAELSQRWPHDAPQGAAKKVIPCRILQIFKQPFRIFWWSFAVIFPVHTGIKLPNIV